MLGHKRKDRYGLQIKCSFLLCKERLKLQILFLRLFGPQAFILLIINY
jgi:hypothetical protein